MKIEEKAKALVAATLKKRELEAALEETQEEIKRLEKAVLFDMAANGAPGLKVIVDSKRWSLAPSSTVYVKRRPNVESEQVVAALKKARLGEFVQQTYNSSRLSSWARERLGVQKKPLPKALADVVVVDTYERVSVVLSTKNVSVSESAAETARAAAGRT